MSTVVVPVDGDTTDSVWAAGPEGSTTGWCVGFSDADGRPVRIEGRPEDLRALLTDLAQSAGDLVESQEVDKLVQVLTLAENDVAEASQEGDTPAKSRHMLAVYLRRRGVTL